MPCLAVRVNFNICVMPFTKIATIPEPPPINQISEDRRLWIGNLDTSVSEYQLLKILEKHGHMEKFDLLFHRSGPLAGLPRGYAFVTYSTNEEAKKVKGVMDGKKIGTKHIIVRWAHNLNMEEREKPKVELEISALTGAKEEQKISRISKIQAIEAKLKMMENNSNREFQLNGGPSGISDCQVYQNLTGVHKTQTHFKKSKPCFKPYRR